MKQLRQRQIRDLVAQRPVRTQLELAAALRERGFRTTQATISRDVAELGLIKVTRDGTTAYALPPRLIEAETSGEDRLKKLLSDLPLEIHEAGLLLVLRTLPGSAHASPPPSTGHAGRRSQGPSQGTTRSSSRSPTEARSSASSAGCTASLRATKGSVRGLSRAFDTHRGPDYHSRPAGTFRRAVNPRCA
jgi:transcriptional regulator of arginine metabolism